MRTLARYALGIAAALALLTGCSGTQPSIGSPGAAQLFTSGTHSPARNAGRGKGAVEFAYVANLYSNNVTAYAINTSTGALTQIQGSPFATGDGPSGMAIDPSGKFVYVANDGGISGNQGSVSAFAINAQSGALTPVQGTPFTAGSNPIGVAITANGKFAYVVNYNSSNISIFAINARTGALKEIQESPHGTRRSPIAEAIDPTGEFVYVTNEGFHPYFHSSHITGYAIDQRTGALRKLSGANLEGEVPASMSIAPSGKFVYVANYGSQNVSAYAIASRAGALSVVKGSPFSTGFNPGAVAIDPSGPFTYVAFDLGVSAYTITPNGALTPVQGSPFGAGYEPDGIAIDPLGKFAYVSSTGPDNYVSAYAINPNNGALTQVQGSPFAAGTHPAAIALCRVVRDACAPPPL